MFNWFKKKENSVYQPEESEIPKIKEPEKPATVYYRIGITDNNRVALSMGYSEITMNRAGVDNLIKQLDLFRSQLESEEEVEE